MFTEAITLTYGDVAENNVGMQQIDSMADSGFTVEQLLTAQALISSCCATEIIKLHEIPLLPNQSEVLPAATVLIIRAGVTAFLLNDGYSADTMYNEQVNLLPDTTIWSTKHGRIVNKVARHNLCFAAEAQTADILNGKGTIIPYSAVPQLDIIRRNLPYLLGPSAANLVVEGNYYYNPKTCGIGYHGDGERRRVVGVRLGVAIPLCFRWYHKNQIISEKLELLLNHGDMYVMSDLAVGTNWKRPTQITVRHAAGCAKYTK
jgi:hypothetical protein